MKRFVIPLLLLTSLLLAACGGGSTEAPTSAPTSAPEVKPTTAAATDAPATAAATSAPAATVAPTTAPPTAAPAAPVLPVGDPKAVVIKAVKAQLTAGPSRTLTLVETSDSKTQLVSEMVPPDRLHITMDSDGKRLSETIIISDTMWTRAGDGAAWNKSPGGAAMLSMMGEKEIDATTNSITDVKLIGPELLNGVATWVYTFTSDRADLGVTSQVKMWIGALNGLVLQQQVEGEAGGVKSKTTQTVTYDPSIKIEAPAQ